MGRSPLCEGDTVEAKFSMDVIATTITQWLGEVNDFEKLVVIACSIIEPQEAENGVLVNVWSYEKIKAT